MDECLKRGARWMNPPTKKIGEKRGMRTEKVSEESEEEIGEKGESI
jgi:hypothetical protein